MAVLFSAVTVAAGNDQRKFLAAGIPRNTDDLEGWTAFDDFMGKIDSEQEVSVHVEAYLYGEGEILNASPEEVAYFTMRNNADEAFLHGHCDNIEDVNFRFTLSHEELLRMEM